MPIGFGKSCSTPPNWPIGAMGFLSRETEPVRHARLQTMSHQSYQSLARSRWCPTPALKLVPCEKGSASSSPSISARDCGLCVVDGMGAKRLEDRLNNAARTVLLASSHREQRQGDEELRMDWTIGRGETAKLIFSSNYDSMVQPSDRDQEHA